MAQSPDLTSSMMTHVKARMLSPSTSIIALVILSMSCAFCSFENTPSMTFTVVNGIVIALPFWIGSHVYNPTAAASDCLVGRSLPTTVAALQAQPDLARSEQTKIVDRQVLPRARATSRSARLALLSMRA
jgi:hypothetical protein